MKRKLKKEDLKALEHSREQKLYDADHDDPSSQSEEHKVLVEWGLQSNIGVMKRAIYIMGSLVCLLFFCSSLFAYLTSRELIFPERSAPKYIFDLI